MPIIEPVIRPPSEADSFLLQITTGCSSNYCTFCGAYYKKPFTVKNQQEISGDIKQWAENYPQTRRVFLLDGDALVVSNHKLIPVLEELKESFPDLARISSYANGYNITQRTDDELKELYDRKLKLIYLGLESGSQEILDSCRKKSTRDEMITAVQRAQNIGIKASVIILLGLGGRKNFKEHIDQTIIALNKMQPRFLSFLSLMLIPKTDLYKCAEKGEFDALNPDELLDQAYQIIKGLELEKTIFRTDHASNYLALEGRFPSDKKYLLQIIEKARAGEIPLKPEIFRGL
ncbi:MAG: radical SAM protein [Candidatus Omnitrophota bacterium]